MKTFDTVRVVDGLDFDVNEGQIYGFLGPNGAGKTSLIRMISCVLPLTAGTLFVDGMDVRYHDRQIKARLGVVPQDNNLDEDLTVRRNLEVYARYHDVPRAVAGERIDEALELMQLNEKADARIDALSGGMKRRLVIARALVNEPRMMILDEPTTGLDPQARHLVWRKVRLLRERGVSILLTTHYMDEAEQLCDRLMILDRGQAIAEGSPRDLVGRYAGEQVLEMHLSEVELAEAQAILSSSGTEGSRLEQVEDVTYAFGYDEGDARRVEAVVSDPYDVRLRRANLEDVYLTLTGRTLVE